MPKPVSFSFIAFSLTVFLMVILKFTPSHAEEMRGQFTDSNICKATVASTMGKDPQIIKIYKQKDDVIFLTYIRQDDNTVWNTKCRVNGFRVLWGNADGRWRNHALDGNISYNVNGDTITITEKHPDNSVSEGKFLKQDLH